MSGARPPSIGEWRALVRLRLAALTLAREPEIVDELAQHLADLYGEAIDAGHTAAEADAIARAALDDPQALPREIARASRTLPGLISDRWIAGAPAPPPHRRGRFMDELKRDLILAARTLRRSPAYTTVVILTLALGIGGNAAIFAAVDGMLLRALPYAHADRLVVPVSINAARSIDRGSVSYADVDDWTRQTEIFEAVALWQPTTLDLTGAGDPERIQGARVSDQFFRVITIPPIAGRTLVADDHEAKAPRVTVISHALWQRSFGGAADIVGRTVTVGGVPHEIVGVMPARGAWPDQASLFLPLRPALLSVDVRTRRDNLIYGAIARLRDGVALSQGDAVLATIAAGLERAFPESRKHWTNRLMPLRDYMVDAPVRRALWILMTAVGAVLLIACANLAHLGLVRGLGRAREVGVRLALGARRAQLVRYLAAESLLLAIAGAGAGLLLAYWSIGALAGLAPPELPYLAAITLDGRVLVFAAALTVFVVAATGLLPALLTSRVRPGPALKDGTPAAGASRRTSMLRNLLIAAEVAGAVVLLVGAALLGRSFWRLQQIDPGVHVDKVLAARLSLPRTPRYETDALSAAFFQQLTDRLHATAGVESAAATSFVPVGGGGFGLGRVFLEEQWPEPPAHADVSAYWNVVTPNYFRTVGIPVMQGRDFGPQDRADSTPVVIVSRSFARQMFGDADPLGHRIRSWRDENLLREIVGVVGEVRYSGLAERETARQVYIPHTQNSWGLMNVVVRASASDPEALEPALRRVIRDLDPTLAVSNVASLRGVAAESIAAERYTMLLLSLLAATALALGATGIYGVVSHAVSLRRRELGVRAALGASPTRLYRLVLRQVVIIACSGVAIGVTLALFAAPALNELLYETPPREPLVYLVTAATILLIAVLSCIGPARRAARVDPVTALRI